MKLDQGSIGKISNFISQHVPLSPVIVQESSGRIRVNDVIAENDGGVWKVSRRGSTPEEFSYKSWAIAYAVALINNNRSVNSYLQNSEKKLAKLITDRNLYRYHREQALRRNDEFKACIIEDRLSRTEGEIFELLDESQQVLLYQQIA